MGARHPYYLLADSESGLRKEAEVTGQAYIEKLTHGNVRQGFVYERVPHVTLKSIANNAELDVLWEEHQPKVEAGLTALNKALRGHKMPFEVTTGGRAGESVRFDAPENATFTMPSGEVVPTFTLVEWEVPREAPDDWPKITAKPLDDFWETRTARQRAIDASIAVKAEFEYLYDKPYEDRKKIRVAGPFTVESLSPHRMLGVDENDELIDPFKVAERGPTYGVGQQFDQMIMENLRVAGVQQKDRGRPHHVHIPAAVARPADMRRGPLPRGRRRAPRRHPHRSRVWDRRPPRLGGVRPRGRRRRLRRADRVRVQFRGPRVGVQ